MRRQDTYAIFVREMAKALVNSVSELGKAKKLTRPNLREALWLLEERYAGFGLDAGYDALADTVIGTIARMIHVTGEDGDVPAITAEERQWLSSVNSTTGDGAYASFLAGKVDDDYGDDEPDEWYRDRLSSWKSTLTRGQREAFDAIVAGKNVFLTGNGGTGKSYLVSGIIDWATSSGLEVIVCAPTGIAALNVGGSTIHRTLGISPDKVLGPKRNPSIPNGSPLPKCDLMIVDEISMCRLDLFDYLSSVLMHVGKERERLGMERCQLVVVGDFFQLPPVMTDDDRQMLQKMYGRDVKGGYPFMGKEWDRWGFARIVLDETIRQRDADFANALEKCRRGDISGARWIEEHASKTVPSDAIVLCGTNTMASKENAMRLAGLRGNVVTYRGSMWGDVRKTDMPTDMNIKLKPGARVMAVANDPDGRFMNGSLGTVETCGEGFVRVGFDSGGFAEVGTFVWPITKPVLEDGRIRMRTVGEFSQVPLKLAWAITIHKSQGQTFNRAVIHPYCWDYGQLYTALSRLTTVGGMRVAKPIQAKYLKASPDVLAFEEAQSRDQSDG